MTVQELYDYAKSHNLLDIEIRVRDYYGSLGYCEGAEINQEEGYIELY